MSRNSKFPVNKKPPNQYQKDVLLKESSKSVVNKSLNSFIKKRYKNVKAPSRVKDTNKQDPVNFSGISIITCTHLDIYMDNIFSNYKRQTLKNKELIVVLNDPSIDVRQWEHKASYIKNVKIIKPEDQLSVGESLNLAVSLASYDYIANFDHDDYYGAKYLEDIALAFLNTDAGLVGKNSQYIYFESSNTLALRNPNHEYQYVNMIDGPTISFRKKIFEIVKFNDALGGDVAFSKACRENNIKIYSTNRFNHVYIRRANKENHAWKIKDEELLKVCKIVGQIEDYIEYVDIRNRS